jgi:hypothetical protein
MGFDLIGRQRELRAMVDCRFRRNPPGHSDLIPPTIPT